MKDVTEGIEGWGQYAKLVVETLDRFEKEIGELRREISNLRGEIASARLESAVEIATLKARSSVWGAVGGAIVSALAAISWMLAKGGG